MDVIDLFESPRSIKLRMDLLPLSQLWPHRYWNHLRRPAFALASVRGKCLAFHRGPFRIIWMLLLYLIAIDQMTIEMVLGNALCLVSFLILICKEYKLKVLRRPRKRNYGRRWS